MPLTNPNKVVTEERLSEFYGQILPYLGGMPEMLANKFSKGDLYSTDEKMIGCWVDSKPLYQKTVTTGGNVPSGATLIQRTTQTGYDTILYTKTTDSPIAIGSDTDYSTDEKIVGTWIDGKPIYSCTYIATLSLADKRTWKNIGSVGNITVRKKDSLYLTSNGSNFGNQDDGSTGNTATSPNMYTSVGLKIENNTLKAYTATLNDSFYPIQYNVTLYYTKNTD